MAIVIWFFAFTGSCGTIRSLIKVMRILKPLAVIFFLGLFIAAFYHLLILPFFFGKARILTMIDPDSLLVRENGKVFRVQLIGADAPELTGPKKGHQCYDYESLKRAAEFFRKDREVTLQIDGKAGEKDVFGRELRYVTLADGTLYNLKLIQEGLAREAHIVGADTLGHYKYSDDFLKAEQEAASKKLGLWGTCGGKF